MWQDTGHDLYRKFCTDKSSPTFRVGSGDGTIDETIGACRPAAKDVLEAVFF